MSDKVNFWEAWAPYWGDMEDNFLDLDSIDELSSLIEGPGLVVGAGQGILVERLRGKGLVVDGIDAEPEMVAYARERRGLDIVLANGQEMPFDDNAYKTSVIATGVIDFMEDDGQIRSIVSEALRVTEDDGKVLVAFCRIPAQGEELMRYTGLLTDEGRWRIKRMFELFTLGAFDFIRTVAEEANVGYVRAFFKLVKLGMLAPRKEQKAVKRWVEMLKKIDRCEELIESVPESLPYRNEESIRMLFYGLDIPVREMFRFASCMIVRV